MLPDCHLAYRISLNLPLRRVKSAGEVGECDTGGGLLNVDCLKASRLTDAADALGMVEAEDRAPARSSIST